MDKRCILISLLLLSTLLYASPTAKEIYEKSAKVLSFEKIRFEVTSLMQSRRYTEEQRFSLTNTSDGDKRATLICFLEPKNIRGTAMLLAKDTQKSSTVVYLPSLGRSRIIPRQEEDNEAFGLGLSFSEMQNRVTALQRLPDIQKGGRSYYRIAKEEEHQKTLYLIDKESMVIREMDIYHGDKAVKKIVVDRFALLHDKPLITQWHIKDFTKKKEIAYRVDTRSITTAFDKSALKRSAISHCQ